MRTRVLRQRRQRAQRTAAGIVQMCVYTGGKLTATVAVAVTQLSAFRAKHPGARACPPAQRPVAPSVVTTGLLDAANDGTFAQARRAALLGHVNVEDTSRAITGLVRAAEDGRVSLDLAAGRIAELANPPVAAALADQVRPPLTKEQADERRRRIAAGTSDSEMLAAQARKLNEACTSRVCYVEGNKATGIAYAIVDTTERPEVVAKFPTFLRFCTTKDLEAAGIVPSSWGEWTVRRLQGVSAKLGLVPPPPTITQRFAPAPTGAPPPTGTAPAPAVLPGGTYTMWSPDRKTVAVVFGYQVPAYLAAGWTMA